MGLADGEVLNMFGVAQATLLSSRGVPWMLATQRLERHARPFLRHSRRAVADMKAGSRELQNFVDARNRKAVLWLRWLGFILHAPQPFGPDQMPVHKFTWQANV